MRSLLAAFGVLASLVTTSQALYFYIDGPVSKCFYEDLPKDTLVVGTSRATLLASSDDSFLFPD